jgi:oxaloacetate decarboxylase gamma subunit
MNTPDLLIEGLKLMVIGMGIVLTFLLLLVGVMRAMSAAAMRLAPEPGLAVGDRVPAAAEQADSELVAVITAAVARYRRRA